MSRPVLHIHCVLFCRLPSARELSTQRTPSSPWSVSLAQSTLKCAQSPHRCLTRYANMREMSMSSTHTSEPHGFLVRLSCTSLCSHSLCCVHCWAVFFHQPIVWLCRCLRTRLETWRLIARTLASSLLLRRSLPRFSESLWMMPVRPPVIWIVVTYVCDSRACELFCIAGHMYICILSRCWCPTIFKSLTIFEALAVC